MKAILNIPSMHFMRFIGFEAYYGTILTTIIVQLLAVIYLLYKLRKIYKLSYKSSLEPSIKIILINGIMMLSLMIIRLFLGSFPTTRLWSFLEIIIYASIGAIIYFYLSYKNDLFNIVFGEKFISKITNKFKKGRSL